MVYVDRLMAYTPSARWPFTEACHLTADSREELDAMAARLGLRPEWIQHPGEPTEHYDLNAARRALAVRLGAREISFWEEAQLIERKRAARRAAQRDHSA